MPADNLVSLPLLAADTLDLETTNSSPITDAFTKGIPSAAISGALSIYNTFVNYAGGDQVSTAEAIQNVDEGMGTYYLQHQDTIDTAGFIGTSLIPGSLGMKGLKLLQAGKAEGVFARFTGFAASRKDQYLSKALSQMAETGGTITSDIIASRRAQMGWAIADNMLTSAAAETAIALTMNDAPIFENATLGDFVKNAAIGSVFGGAIGGLLDNMAARGVLKAAQSKIEGKMRFVDTIFVPENLNVNTATKIGDVLEQIIYRPETDFSIPFAYRVPGSKLFNQQELDISQALKSARNRTERVAFDTVSESMNELAEGAGITGQAFHGMIYSTIKNMRDAGEAPDAISEVVRGYLNVKRIGALAENEADLAAHPEQFFLNKKPTSFEDLYSTTRGKQTGKQAYTLNTTDASLIKTATAADGFNSVWEAFAAGYDVAVGKSGQMIVNPKSKYIVRVKDAAVDNRFYVDLASGELNRDIIVTGADMLKRDSDFIRLADEVVIAGKRFKQEHSVSITPDMSPLQVSARYMWAKDMPASAFSGRTILWDDFPLLDKLREFGSTSLIGKNAPEILMADGSRVKYNELVNPAGFVNERKIDWLVQKLDSLKKADGSDGGRDLRLWANELNMAPKKIEELINSGFSPTRSIMSDAQPLSTYFSPKTVRMEWNDDLPQLVKKDGTIPSYKDVNGINGPGPNHMATTILADQYRVKTALNEQRNAFTSVFGKDADQFIQLSDRLALKTTSDGSGAGQFTSSNAGYGQAAELFVQDTGKALHLLQQKWRDNTVGALMGNISAIRASKEAAAELGAITTAMRRDARKYVFFEDDITDVRRLVDREAVDIYRKSANGDNPLTIDEAIDFLKQQAHPSEIIRGEYKIQNQEVEDFLIASRDVNADRLRKSTVLHNASGLRVTRDPETIYIPPIDTTRYPHHAFVVAKERVGAATDVSMITAKDAEQLRKLAGEVGDDFDVIYRNDTKRYFKAKDTYDYDMTIHESKVNSSLQRTGKLGDFFPETKAENVLEDYVRWHANASDQLARTGVQVNNRQFFNDMNWLADRWADVNESTAGGVGFLNRKSDANPFRDYVKTALNISKRNEFPVLDSLNEFVDKVGTEAYSAINKAIASFRQSEGKDMVSLEKANKLMDDYGLGTPYNTLQSYLVANEGIPKNLIKVAFQKANLFLANTVLRLDFANSLVNIVSTPIMLGTELNAIKHAIGNDPALAGKLAELTSIKVPGRDMSVPSNTRLIGDAIKNFFGPNKQQLLDRYKANGDIKDVLTLYHEVLDGLSYLPKQDGPTWSKKVEAAVEKGGQITGNNFAEEFTRFVSADVMRQLTEPLVTAGKIDLKEANSYISSFVNRVQGNYISSQRPVLFQGTTGAAIGLFQTYSFNVLQQLFRHMEDRNTKALLTFGGLQSAVYGLNGLPFFDAINQHLIGTASGNRLHQDAYSFLPAASKEYGDWMLYGTASAFPLLGESAPALYSRGDINPRHLSIVPINPVDIPAVQASIKVVDSVLGFAKSVSQGADLSSSFLFALEHHGLNRPLAGFAQVLQGRSTTAQGSLISAANDMQTTSMLAAISPRLGSFGGVARLMGAKPMDEAVVLNNMYRDKAYEAVDRARINDLGIAVKTKLYANQAPSSDEMTDFMDSYARAGGRIENFSSTMQHWQRDANQSVINQTAAHLKTMRGQRAQINLGGIPLTDYTNQSVE